MTAQIKGIYLKYNHFDIAMLKNIRKNKIIFALVIGLALITATHSMAMNLVMDPTNCMATSSSDNMAKKMCSDCTVPVLTEVPAISPAFQLLSLVPELEINFQEVSPFLFYHPPK